MIDTLTEGCAKSEPLRLGACLITMRSFAFMGPGGTEPRPMRSSSLADTPGFGGSLAGERSKLSPEYRAHMATWIPASRALTLACCDGTSRRGWMYGLPTRPAQRPSIRSRVFSFQHRTNSGRNTGHSEPPRSSPPCSAPGLRAIWLTPTTCAYCSWNGASETRPREELPPMGDRENSQSLDLISMSTRRLRRPAFRLAPFRSLSLGG
jgi:hypothetical protein